MLKASILFIVVFHAVHAFCRSHIVKIQTGGEGDGGLPSDFRIFFGKSPEQLQKFLLGKRLVAVGPFFSHKLFQIVIADLEAVYRVLVRSIPVSQIIQSSILRPEPVQKVPVHFLYGGKLGQIGRKIDQKARILIFGDRFQLDLDHVGIVLIGKHQFLAFSRVGSGIDDLNADAGAFHDFLRDPVIKHMAVGIFIKQSKDVLLLVRHGGRIGGRGRAGRSVGMLSATGGQRQEQAEQTCACHESFFHFLFHSLFLSAAAQGSSILTLVPKPSSLSRLMP